MGVNLEMKGRAEKRKKRARETTGRENVDTTIMRSYIIYIQNTRSEGVTCTVEVHSKENFEILITER